MTQRNHDLLHSFAHVKGCVDKILKHTASGIQGDGRHLFVDINAEAIMALGHLCVIENHLTSGETC